MLTSFRYKFLSFFLFFLLIFSNVSFSFFNYKCLVYERKVRADALTPALITSMADYVVAEGLIAAGVTIAAPVVLGVAAAGVVGYCVYDYVKDHPDVYKKVKDSISAGATSAFTLTDEMWTSLRSYAQSNYKVGSNTFTSEFTLDSSYSSTFENKHNAAPIVSSYINRAGYKTVVYSSLGYCTLDGMHDVFHATAGSGAFVNFFYICSAPNYIYQVVTLSDKIFKVGDICNIDNYWGDDYLVGDVGSFVASTPVAYTGDATLANPAWDFKNQEGVRSVPLTTSPNLGSLVGVASSVITGSSAVVTPVDPPSTGILQGLWDFLKSILQSILNAIWDNTSAIFGQFGTLFGRIADSVGSIASAIGRAVGSVTSEISSDVGAVATAVEAIPIAIEKFFDLDKPVDFTPLKVAGLTFTTVFPFSLPWDLLHSFSFVASPSLQPDFSISLAGLPLATYCGLDKVSIDLSDYNTMFSLVKFFELLLFDVGLIFTTRKLLGGSV